MQQVNIYDISTPEELKAAVRRAPGRVILRFHRIGCPACDKMAGTWLDMSRRPDYANVTFVGINVEDNRELANAFNIESIPTFMSLDRGVANCKFVGADPIKLRRLIETGSV
jgi:thiol-disulfide isomerase/thioredoxin